MTTSAHPLFAEALAELGLDLTVRSFPEGTRTAADAAAAIGCELSQIVKSLVFAADGVPVLVLMDGASRVDVDAVRRELGAGKVTRADAALVRETTGYAIGPTRRLQRADRADFRARTRACARGSAVTDLARALVT
ncbi:YbaK/EbsC family protein [Streptomyces sp. NPDC001584]|uniref:YbaK/EbsC family protein n=1 Tax=Streptomyces sp. NPDC001584 TaxID=3154521 RepID=UPI00332A6DA2